MSKEIFSTQLTKSQSLLWIGQQINPDSPMYNMIMTYEINSALNISVFKQAFDELVKKSDVLRSVFFKDKDIPYQKYLPSIKSTIEYLDFSEETNPKEVYKKWQKNRVTILFNLEKKLFDCALIKLSKSCFIWYINQHHLITDGWSTTIMFSKLNDLYCSILKDNSEIIKEDFPEFKSYALNYNENFTSKKAAEYWQKKATKLTNAPELYFKKNNFSQTNSERSLIKIGLDRTNKLKELANQKGIRGWTLDATLYNVFLTTLFSFLYRVTGQEKLIIGSPTHNRISKKLKNTIGLFIESFPLQINIEEKETFISLFSKVQLESNNFLKNAQAGSSFASLSRSYNTFFNYINTTNSKFSGASVKTSWVHPEHTDPRHQIRLHVHDFDNTGEINLYFDLNTTVFNTEERTTIPKHFLAMLDAFIEDNTQEIEKPAIISKEEINKINNWNNTSVNFDKNETLLTKFSQQVLKTPNETAILFDNKKLTYLELDKKSNQVANFLIQKGIKKNDIVTISMHRSLEMMIYIYGVLKAGAAYLPLDTNLPQERLRFIVKDANSKILFHNHDDISSKSTIDCYHTSSLESEIALLDSSSNNINVLPDDLAYVIYTSGSSGSPKGVECLHKGICNRLNWMNVDFPLSKKDVLLQKTPVTFDVSLIELFWPLQTGASLVIAKPDEHKNPEALIETIQKHQINYIHFVPSMLDLFIKTKDVENCSSLEKMFCSGEILPLDLVIKANNKLNVTIYNLYGPTETSVEVTSWLCNKNTTKGIVPIGKPVANTKLYIADKHMNLAPIGLPGELYISGVQVAKGYLNRPNLTKELFLDDSFTEGVKNTMYKTGDLVRYRQDGAIEYLGRIDNQIKLHGQRIELSEIEKTLEKLDSISKALVTVNDQNNLIAYYTGENINKEVIITFSQENLPSYMVPSGYVYLKEFNYLSSGKIDIKSLYKYKAELIEESQKATKKGPTNEIEEIIYNIWKEVLKIDKIGVYENFIRLGGNSLDAISITSRVKETLELDVSIKDVFNFPTIKSYAANVEAIITKLLND